MSILVRRNSRRIDPILAFFAGIVVVLESAVYGEEAAGGESAEAASAPGLSRAYEEAPTLQASDILPAYLFSSPLHTVDSDVRNDGTTNHYVVYSPLGDVEALGREELGEVIQELRALELLQGTRKGTGAALGFNQGVKGIVTRPYRSVKRVVFNPLYAIEAVPTEIADYASKLAAVSDLFEYGPKVFIRRSLGIEGARKEIARRLHVDDDTDNEALRAEIKRVGWGVWYGGIVPNVGEGYMDLKLDLATEVGNVGSGNLGRAVDAVRREVFPRTARRMLRKMGVPKPTVKEFRKHPEYDGRMRENLAVALLTMEETENKEAFVLWAMGAEEKREARQAVRLAQVLAVYHAAEVPVSEIRRADDALLFEDGRGIAVAPLTYDYLIWSAPADDALADAEALNENGLPLEIWSLGEFSPTLHEELSSRGYDARTRVAESLPRFERPRKGLKRLEQRYERNVEQPIKGTVRNRLMPQRQQRIVLDPLGPTSR